MVARLKANARFSWAYFLLNLKAAAEYRASTLWQLVGMFVNDAMWVAFWVVYFQRFPVISGWTLQDVITLWAACTAAFGIAGGFFVNCLRIPQLVVQGQLDYYLTLPKGVLLHLLVSQMRPTNLGDLLFGPTVLMLFVRPTGEQMLIYVACVLLCAIIMLGFFVALGSLTFFLGNADALSGQLIGVFIHFATYPAAIFDGAVKVVLFTLIPAGFISTLPAVLMREFDWLTFGGLFAGAAGFSALGIWAFYAGLKRYESGNLTIMRS